LDRTDYTWQQATHELTTRVKDINERLTHTVVPSSSFAFPCSSRQEVPELLLVPLLFFWRSPPQLLEKDAEGKAANLAEEEACAVCGLWCGGGMWLWLRTVCEVVFGGQGKDFDWLMPFSELFRKDPESTKTSDVFVKQWVMLSLLRKRFLFRKKNYDKVREFCFTKTKKISLTFSSNDKHRPKTRSTYFLIWKLL
jgi:hypothetical protein